MANFNSIVERALSEHTGSGIYSKKSNGYYSLFLPVTNTGELGSAPEQLDKTVIGNMASTYVNGRQDSPQQSLTIFNNRDNVRIIEAIGDDPVDFLRVFPDFSGVKYSGTITKTYTDTALNSLEQLTLTVTVTTTLEVVDDCYDLLQDTAMFTNDIPTSTTTTVGGTKSINVATNPGDAEVTATSENTGVATVTYSNGVATITGVAAGSAIITLTVSKDDYASWTDTIHVIVE